MNEKESERDRERERKRESQREREREREREKNRGASDFTTNYWDELPAIHFPVFLETRHQLIVYQ